ncbi:MAG: DUF3604 domain-containing protein [Pseudomonadota bacterium]
MTIPDHLMGDVWPAAKPGPDNANYGTTAFSPTGSFPVRSLQTFTLVYTVGEFGLDDTGAIKVVHRWTDDGGRVQFDDPSTLNYVTATASNGVQLELHAEPYPHRRPWFNGLRITVKRGYMRPGDTITVVYGDTAQGSPGYRLQTFCETAYAFRVLADVCATGVFLPVAEHTIAITAGPLAKWVLTAPTRRRAGEAFSLGIRGEDAWGNATERTPANVTLTADGAVDGLADSVACSPGARATRVDGLQVNAPGTYRFTLSDPENDLTAISNPLVVAAQGPAHYWGDLHGQSGETVGIDSVRDYLQFARDTAFLDVTSHQANDFQITNAFWDEINAVSAELNTDGQFVVFPGYEWSGNTPVGGDHNVFFADEGRPIRRSSHALLTDRSDLDADAHTLPALFDALEHEDCVLYAHVGGRPADIGTAEHARLRTAVEVHSDWGTFEWILTDAFDLGYRVGVVCNSDGHKGAPGACYPGASEFGAYSGLTCFIADDLSRASIFNAMRSRRHYGTTGCRMHLEVTADLGAGGAVYPVDPRIDDTPAVPSDTAQMGDIVRLDGDRLDLSVAADTHAPIERIDVLNGRDTVMTLRPYRAGEASRVRVIWEGAEYRGRGRTTHWQGTLRCSAARITAIRPINHWNLERTIALKDDHTVRFDAVTTGNFGGCDLWLDDTTGLLEIDTNLVRGTCALADIGDTDTVFDAGGLERRIRVFRLPEHMDARHLTERLPIALVPGCDNPLWVRATTEDGFVGWSSPIYVTR